MEVHLGTSLMVKSGRRVVLTEAGERYFEMIAENLDRIADATQNVRGYLSVEIPDRARHPEPVDASGSCRASTGFSTRTRDLDVRIDATNEPTDFSREGVDIEIRHGEGNWPGLFVEGLAEERFLPVCAPSLCAPGTLEPRRSARLPPDPLGEIADAVGTLVRGRRGRPPQATGAACCSTAATWRSTPP